jgi:glycosyltransferase involved in cell wall biosynthesis
MPTPSIMLFIPAYRCEKQVKRVIASLDADTARRFTEVAVVENRSPDNTLQSAREALAGLAATQACKATLLQNDANYNLGGSHKVAFNYCLEKGHDYLVVLHGDDQGDIHDLLPLLNNGDFERFDCLLGARFHSASKLPGYSRFRIFGNIVFNALISAVTRTWVLDMGAGLNLYRADFLSSRFYMTFPDDLTFNVYMLYYTIWKQAPFRFFPLTWKEDDQTSNAKMFRQAAHILKLTWRYMRDASGLFDQPCKEGKTYTSKNIPLGAA